MRLRCEITPGGFAFAVETDRPCHFSIRYVVQMTGGHWTAGRLDGHAAAGRSRHRCASPLPVLSVGVDDVAIVDADAVEPSLSRSGVVDDARADIQRHASADVPVFSVVVPVHEGAASIDRCMASILEQSYQRFEIIVVDDGSRDSTLGAVARYFEGDDAQPSASRRVESSARMPVHPTDDGDRRSGDRGPTRVISFERRQGIACALNEGLYHCRGEWIVPLGVDHRLHALALAALARAAERFPDAGGLFGTTRLCAGDTPLDVQQESGRDVCGFADCLEYGRVQTPAAYRVRLLRRLGGWKTDDGEGGGSYQEQLTAARVAEVAPMRYVHDALAFLPASALTSRWRGVSAAALKTSIVEWEAAQRGLAVRSEWAGEVLRLRFSSRARPSLRHRWSVVIAASSGGALLRNALQSWLESDGGASAAELTVVDDSTSQDLRANVPSDIGDHVRWLATGGGQGAAAARNAGARASASEYLYFSDADRIVQSDTLIAHESAHAVAGDDALVVGSAYGRYVAALSAAVPLERRRRLLQVVRERAIFDQLAGALAFGRDVQPGGSGGIWSRLAELSFADASSLAWAEFDLRNGRSGDEGVGRWLRVDAGALSMSRTSWRRLGGFDEQLGSFEDWDLGVRAVEHGFRIVPEPAAEPLQQLHATDPSQSPHAICERLHRMYPRHVAALSTLPTMIRPPGAESILRGVQPVLPCDAEAVRCDSMRGFCLTFDDGPHAVNTPAILDRLDEFGWPATFFVLGCRASDSRDLVKEIAMSRHALAVHAWDHRHPCEVGSAEMDAGMRRTVHLLEDLTGERVSFCRPPYGELTPAYAKVAQALKLTPVGWDVSSKDWHLTRPQDVMTELAVAGVCAKVMLFHDGCGDGAVLADVLAWLARHATISLTRAMTLDELSQYRDLPRLEPRSAVAAPA